MVPFAVGDVGRGGGHDATAAGGPEPAVELAVGAHPQHRRAPGDTGRPAGGHFLITQQDPAGVGGVEPQFGRQRSGVGQRPAGELQVRSGAVERGGLVRVGGAERAISPEGDLVVRGGPAVDLVTWRGTAAVPQPPVVHRLRAEHCRGVHLRRTLRGRRGDLPRTALVVHHAGGRAGHAVVGDLGQGTAGRAGRRRQQLRRSVPGRVHLGDRRQ